MNRRASWVFCSFIICMLLTSCSALNFVAAERTPFKIAASKDSDQFVEHFETRDFYFWGMSPREQKIDFEDFSNLVGLSNPSYVSIEQSTGWKSFFFTVITLGVYCPVDYKIKVLTRKETLN